MVLSYIDSNSGSLMAQAAAAGFAGAAVVIKLGWHRATGHLRRNRGRGTPEAPADAQKHDS